MDNEPEQTVPMPPLPPVPDIPVIVPEPIIAAPVIDEPIKRDRLRPPILTR